MGRCKHRHTCDVDRCGFLANFVDGGPVHRRWCWDCSSYIGFGPSNDSAEVRTEIHAVEVFAAHLAKFTPEEAEDWPWSDCPFVDDEGNQCWRCQGEDLARIIATHCITTHDETRRGE